MASNLQEREREREREYLFSLAALLPEVASVSLRSLTPLEQLRIEDFLSLDGLDGGLRVYEEPWSLDELGKCVEGRG